MASEHTSIRKRVGISKARTAKLAGCSIPLVTLYEADDQAVGEEKRADLARVYAGFRDLAKTVGIDSTHPPTAA